MNRPAKPNVERVSIWVLEALEGEWRREPDLLKCRPVSEVLEPLKSAHQIEDEDINRAIRFMLSPSRAYITGVNRHDGQAMQPSDNGQAILAHLALARLEENEKKQWSRSDKIALAGFLFSIVTFVAGFLVGDHTSKTPDNSGSSVTNRSSQPTASLPSNISGTLVSNLALPKAP